MSDSGVITQPFFDEAPDEACMSLHCAANMLIGLDPKDIGPVERDLIAEIELTLEALKGALH